MTEKVADLVPFSARADPGDSYVRAEGAIFSFEAEWRQEIFDLLIDLLDMGPSFLYSDPDHVHVVEVWKGPRALDLYAESWEG